MQQVFSTPEPVELYVEIGSGTIQVRADDVDETTVDVSGNDADDVTIEQRGRQIVVRGPQRRTRLFGSSTELYVKVTVPIGSDLSTETGSADLDAVGQLGNLRANSGSGMVRAEAAAGDVSIQTGSGDIRLRQVDGNLRTQSGSGGVYVDTMTGSSSLSSGSGDLEVGTAQGELACKSGSGDVVVASSSESLTATTASGDISVGNVSRGSIRLRAVSGDVIVGVTPGVPVWTDVSCLSGRVTSHLAGAGQPEDGQDYIELRVNTVSGDVVLEER